MNFKDILDSIYKVLMIATLVYVGYEIHSLKTIALQGRSEINYVTSKLDYVTSDINIKQVSN